MIVFLIIVGLMIVFVILGFTLRAEEKTRRHSGVLWQVLVPEKDSNKLPQMAAFLEELYRGCFGNALKRQHFSLEYYADVHGTRMYMWFPESFLVDKDLPTFISGFFPNSIISPISPEEDPTSKEDIFAMEFMLSSEYTAPLSLADELAGDGVAYLANHLSVYQPGHFVGMQIVCEPNKNWVETMNKFVMEFEQNLNAKEPHLEGGDSFMELLKGALSPQGKPKQTMVSKPKSPLEESNLKRWKKLLTDPGGHFGFHTEIRIYTNMQENLSKYATLLNFFSGGNALKAKAFKEVKGINNRWMLSKDYKHHIICGNALSAMWHPPNEDTTKSGPANLVFSRFQPTPLPVGAFVLDFDEEYKAQNWLETLIAQATQQIQAQAKSKVGAATEEGEDEFDYE